jgi:hypothetical protein
VLAYTINRLGTWIGVVSLSVAVFDHTHSALAVAALLVSAQVLPAFVTPVLVARIEGSSRSGLLAGLYVFEAAATAALAVLLWDFFWLPAVLALVALDGAAALAASALLRAAVARAAREGVSASFPSPEAGNEAAHEAERRANASLNVGFSITFAVGPAIAGVLVAAAGAPTALILDAATFLICGAMLIDVHVHVQEDQATSVRSRLKTAWGYINNVPALRALLLIQGAALIFFESAAPIEVPYAKAVLQAGDSGYGVLLGAWGLGVVGGSLIFARSASRSLGLMLSAGTLAVGVAYLGFAAAPNLGLASVAAVVGGIGNGVQWASVLSSVQRLTPHALHGRVIGALESLGAVCPAIGLTIGGALVALSSPRTAFTVTGLGATAITVAFARLSARGLASPADASGVLATDAHADGGGERGSAGRAQAGGSDPSGIRSA